MPEFVLHFDEVKGIHSDKAGNKGCTLARLRQADFPVPSGVIITADAYRAFVAANSLDDLIAEALTDDDLTAASIRRIEVVFREAEMPLAVAAAIHDAYLALGEGKVAVRSSALAEDSEAASFAGQYETFLGIVGCDAVLAAVRRCWTSLWSKRALVYRDRLGCEVDDATMAVVVQKMVPAAQAGVAFTLDPVSGRRDVIVVEAVDGVGEALVGGQTAPHHYVVQEGMDPCRVGDDLLVGEHLAAVVELARAVEVWAGAPQDVEWALDETGRLYLLQARPITVAGAGESVRWTRDNVGEVIPEPVTPLSWSVLEPLGNGAFAGLLRRLGMDEVPARLFGRFYGRVYLNQTLDQALFQKVVGRFYLSRAALRVLLLLRRLPDESKSIIGAILEQHRSDDDLDLTTLAPVDLLARLANWRRLGAAAMEVHLTGNLIAELLYQVLDRLLIRWGDGTVTAATLTSGLTAVRSAEAGQALAALAQQVSHDDDLRDLVLRTTPEALPTRLADTEAGRALWAQIKIFLAEYGHSAAQEFELAAPRWRDDPTIVMSALQMQVRAFGVRGVEEAGPQVGKQPDGFSRFWPGALLVKETRRFVAQRENLKDAFVLDHSYLRRFYLALGKVMTYAGALDEATMIFFLTHDEIAEWVAGWLSPEEARSRVAMRKAEWQRVQRRPAPFALEQWPDGRLLPQERALSFQDDAIDVLQGVPVSCGTFAGRARVARTPAEAAALEPGEVLVVSAVTPGWAPLLQVADALVTEIGSVLSHGAIIAREYGLPAVMNIPNATQLIRTGRHVLVDGTQGLVHLLEET